VAVLLLLGDDDWMVEGTRGGGGMGVVVNVVVGDLLEGCYRKDNLV
jgi:hypothetical protein